MPDNNIATAPDVLTVNDCKVFGHNVIRFAFLHPDYRPKNLQELQKHLADGNQDFKLSDVFNVPEGLNLEEQKVVFAQGDINTHVINLPPLYKLLPLLEFVGATPDDFLRSGDEMGVDIDGVEMAGSVPAPDGQYYKFPEFYKDYYSEESDNSKEVVKDLFKERIGDYSYNGCR